jgi:ABC-type lipoprotein export system ATPase subunit
MDIEKHLDMILEKYHLHNMYKKYIITSILSTTVRESFYWALLYLNDIIQENPLNLMQYSIMLICLYFMQIPIKDYAINTRISFIKEIRLANIKYFSDKIIGIKKDTILSFDLIEYHNALDHFNDYFQEYILNLQIKYDIPIRCITLLVIAKTQKFPILVGMCAILFSVIIVLNQNKIIKESKLTKELYDVETQMRNYMINSKQFIVNSEFNRKYFDMNANNAESINMNISNLSCNLDTTMNIMLFIFVMLVFYIKQNDLTPIGFFYYFLMIYDIEWIIDKINEYYKNKINYNRMKERLIFLYSIKIDPIVENMDVMTPSTININVIEHDMPKISIMKPLVIKPNDHILVQGESGSGKTSLLYVLKGMLKCNKLTIDPNITTINKHSYIILSNNKSIFSGNLYDIITNYEECPSVELINSSIIISKMDHKFSGNDYVDIETLSGGERIRLIIARLIYLIKKNPDRQILLFDEIDDNLNNKLAVEIATNLLDIFKDKTILYITHNDKVKELFKNKITVVDGMIVV